MKCKPLILGLDITGLEVDYPLTTRTLDPTVIPNYVSQGYSLFRLLLSWERLQPSLASYLVSGTTAPLSIPLDSNYVADILKFVDACTQNNVNIILQFDRGGWYDVSFDGTYVNDGTTSCPSSNFVYVGQTTNTTVNSVNYIGPTVSQFSNMFISLMAELYESEPLSSYSNIRIGLGQNTSIENSEWVPIINTTMANIRTAGISNIIHFDFYDSGYDGMSYLSSITDTNSIFSINHNNDGNNGSGTAVLTTDDYLMTAIAINNTFQNITTPVKISFGDVRFDSGSTSLTSLENFISYLSQNISTFESVCLFGIGDSKNLPSYYDLNYTTTSGVITYPVQITTASSSKTSLPSKTNISLSEITLNSTTYIYDSPFGTSYQSVSSGNLYLPYNVFNNGMNLTIECWFKSDGTTTSGILFGASNLLVLSLSSTLIDMKIGDLDYIQFKTDTNIFDQTWHHFEIDIDNSSGIYFFIDGNLIGKSIVTWDHLDSDFTKYLGLNADGNTLPSNTLSGEFSNLVIWNKALHTEDFSLMTTYYTGMEDSLFLCFPLNGNLKSQNLI